MTATIVIIIKIKIKPSETLHEKINPVIHLIQLKQ